MGVEYVEGPPDPEKPVKDAPYLEPGEKEVTLSICKDQDEFIVHSDVGTVTKWLLNHEHTTLIETREVDGVIGGVRARLPIGCVKLQANKRKSANFSQLVAAPLRR